MNPIHIDRVITLLYRVKCRMYKNLERDDLVCDDTALIAVMEFYLKYEDLVQRTDNLYGIALKQIQQQLPAIMAPVVAAPVVAQQLMSCEAVAAKTAKTAETAKQKVAASIETAKQKVAAQQDTAAKALIQRAQLQMGDRYTAPAILPVEQKIENIISKKSIENTESIHSRLFDFTE